MGQFFTPDGRPLHIYRKGKKHRVLVDDRGNVVAYNGLFKKGIKRGAKAVLGEVPGASTVMEAVGFAGDILKDKPSPAVSTPTNRYTTEERVRDALRR
jgi:hypothetical protein